MSDTGVLFLGRFLRFAKDFRKKEGYRLPFEERIEDSTRYIRLSLRDACEFMSRKDYTDNWESEMHETFCFWGFEEWKEHLLQTGFKIPPSPELTPIPGSSPTGGWEKWNCGVMQPRLYDWSTP